jgi:release factor glutamine methyltransferase
MDDIGFDRGSDLMRRHLAGRTGPTQFTLMGRDWDLLDGVFNPSYTPVTRLFSEHLPYPRDGSFLEMGCGAGVTAVVAALSGCRSVTALDISEAAVANTKLNAVRHGVADTVQVELNALFDALAPDERLDVIFWNSNLRRAAGRVRQRNRSAPRLLRSRLHRASPVRAGGAEPAHRARAAPAGVLQHR